MEIVELILKNVGKRIQKSRLKEGISQMDFSRKIGIEDSALRRIEKGVVRLKSR